MLHLQQGKDSGSLNEEAEADQMITAIPDASLTELPGVTHQAEPSQHPEHGSTEAQHGAGDPSHDMLPTEASDLAQAAGIPGVCEGHIHVTVQKADVPSASDHGRYSVLSCFGQG